MNPSYRWKYNKPPISGDADESVPTSVMSLTRYVARCSRPYCAFDVKTSFSASPSRLNAKISDATTLAGTISSSG